MLLEISKRKISLPKHEEPNISWQNSMITVRSLKHLKCFELACDFNSFEKRINVIESNITCTKNSPVPPSLLQKYVKAGLKNIELTEMVIDSSFWPYNNSIMQELVQIVSFEWSPPNIIFNHPILAIINSCGNVDLYSLKQKNIVHMLNMSETLRKHMQPSKIQVPNDFDDMRNKVYSLATGAVCWATQLDQDKSCYFVTAQKSGEIIFWKIKYVNNEIHTDFIDSLTVSKSDIETILWVQNVNNFCLLCVNTSGLVIAYMFSKTMKLIREIPIWEHEDKMIARHINYVKCKENILFIYSKHRHIVLQLYNKKFDQLSQYVKIVNDHKITSVVQCSDGFYIATINAKIYKVTYKIINNELSVSIDNVPFKELSPTYELYGLSVSENKTLFAVALLDRRVFCRKESAKIEIVFSKIENSFEYDIDRILNNPTKQLTNLWDHFEVIRYNIFKTKKLPDIDYEKLFLEGQSDVYKMKIYLALLIFYINLKTSTPILLTSKLPEVSIEKVKEDVLMLHAVNILNSIFNKHHMDKLSNFKLECFHGARRYVSYYCEKYERDMTEFVSQDICNWPKSNFKYICQSCDEEIEGFSCKLGHFNPVCFLTFTPIENNDYLHCKSCKIIARAELVDIEPKCVFCDAYLNLCI